MLSSLGDPHAREAVLGLRDALRDEEGPYLARLLQAVGDVRACHFDPPTLQAAVARACIFNASSEPKKDLGIRLRALATKVDVVRPLGPPPPVLYENTLRVPGELAPKTGVMVEAPFGASGPDGAQPGAFEVLTDRIDLLP